MKVKPTKAAASPPTLTQPSTPTLKAPVRKAIAVASPVKISGRGRQRRGDPLGRTEGFDQQQPIDFERIVPGNRQDDRAQHQRQQQRLQRPKQGLEQRETTPRRRR